MFVRFFKVIAVLVLLSLMIAPFDGSLAKGDTLESAAQPGKHTLAASETGLYIIRLKDAPLAAYQGGVAGLGATSPEATGVRRLDPSTVTSRVYLSYLGSKQGELLRELTGVLGHPVEATFQYKNVMNAVAVKLDYAEALQVLDLPGVLAVYPDQLRQLETDIGPSLIGAPAIWTGNTPGTAASYGEGITIGVIDSGINHAHPSFADVGNDGYDHTNPYGAGNYVGACDSDPAYAGFCNDKLIGAYDLTNLLVGSGGPEDEDGHGSHTASTAGGNFVQVTFDDGAGGSFTADISGVAPHANLIAYRVCDDGGGCQTAATVAAVDHAIADGVDVLNYSISGTDDPWADPVDLAFLDAFTAGIFVSASAGNAGPDAGTVAKTGPWNAAVAASTHSRIIAHPLDVVATGGSLLALGAVEGSGPALSADFTDQVLYGGEVNPANYEGCDAWSGTPFAGKIGMVQRGTCAFEVKVTNLFNAGATAALVFNNVGGPPIVMGGLEATTIPSMMLSLEQGQAVVDLITGDPLAEVTMYVAQSFVYDDAWADIMAGFSSRGPSQWDLLKPDYTAPGVNILAAVAAADGDPVQYDFYQGTSMASPHGAGSAALLMALHPEWSPAAVKSAIATTADQAVLDSDGVTPADPFDDGSGRIDLSAAAFAGFVLEETSVNYIAANPYGGGEAKTLNQPSMVDNNCVGTCSWTRTIQSTLDYDQAWQLSFASQPGMLITASPMNFTLAAGGTQTIEITADVSASVIDTFSFGDVVLTPLGNASVSIAHLPVVARFALSDLVDQLDIHTNQLSGAVVIEDVQSSLAIENLFVEVAGLAKGVERDLLLNQDPTNNDAFDDLSQVFWTTINVPRATMRLVAEVVASDAPDVDLYIGLGNTPSADTVVCVSASGVWAEYCNLNSPARGTYWMLVQNWQGSAAPPDAIRAVAAIVTDDQSNLTITGPESLPALEIFDLAVNWDVPSMVLGDYWYGQFSVGTERRAAGNIGTVNVDLEYTQAIYDVSLAPSTQDAYGDPGVAATHTLTLTNTGNLPDTYTLSYADNLWVTSLSDTSLSLAAGESATITVDVTIPINALAGAIDAATIVATSTSDPLQTAEVLVNTHANAVYDVDLSPATDSGASGPGNVVSYLLTLTNLGNATDTFTLAASGNLWGTTLSDTSVTVGAGATGNITVNVTVPADALVGESDTAIIVATSTNDSLQTAQAVLTTSASAVSVIDLSPATDSGEADPGNVVSYLLTLSNLGNAADTITVAASGNLWGTTLSDTSLILAAGASASVTVDVTVPADALVGALDTATIVATSTTDPLQTDQAVLSTSASAVYDVDLSPATDSGEADPGNVVSYLLTLTNMGNATDTITVAASGNLWGTALSDASLTLAAGESTSVTVDVTVPTDALVGESDSATIVATSTTDPLQTAQAVLSTSAGAVYEVGLTPATDSGADDPGNVVSYLLTLTNLGNATDTITVAATGNLWGTTLSDTSVSLAAGASASVTVNVTVPTDALAGALDTVTIVAASTTDLLKTDQAVLSTSASAVYDVDLSPATDAGEDEPGKVVTYLLTLSNQGNAVDTITVAASGNLWGVNLPQTSFDVATGGSVEVTVEVTIPAGALDGAFDAVTITATSEGGVQDVSVLTTTAEVLYHINLPLIYQFVVTP